MNVCIDKPFYFWIIIPALEIVEACFRIPVIAAVADGVAVCDMVGIGDFCAGGVLDGYRVAPGIVGITSQQIA